MGKDKEAELGDTGQPRGNTPWCMCGEVISDSINRVELLSSASKWNSLSVSSLGATNSNDASTGKDLKGWWVNTLLIDHDKVLVSSITE